MTSLTHEEQRKKIVSYFISKHQMISPTFMEYVNDENVCSEVYELLFEKNTTHLEKYRHELHERFQIVLDDDILYAHFDFEKYKAYDYEKTHPVKKVFNYHEHNQERKIDNFVTTLTERYNKIKRILMQREQLYSSLSINRVLRKTESEEISIIAFVYEKRETRNGHIMLTMEDPTGYIKVLINKNKDDLLQIAKNMVLDEVVAIVGKNKGDIIFAEDIVFPDIPAVKAYKKGNDDIYCAFIGDLHYGTNLFIYDEFEKFIQWLRGEYGTDEQKEIAQKIKYLFVVGDLVEGVGIYPNQENDLDVDNIYEQYRQIAEQFNRIPPHIRIIICAGNHDAMRISEPQPELTKGFAAPFHKLPNVELVTNPSYLTIEKKGDFPGFDFLMYHGYSLVYYADKIEEIRNAGGQKRVDLVLQYLLQRRHLAPTHSSTLALPDGRDDYLCIPQVPDFFVTGHIHRLSVSKYNGVINMNCSCWSSISSMQEKLGLVPQPGRVIVSNLMTRDIKILNFYEEKAKQEETSEE
jgi:DNA polymerase II small subunit